MNRHPFRWLELTLGIVLLAAVGSWAVWHEDLLTPRQLSLSAAGVLIVLGIVGIAATLRGARPSTTSPSPAPTVTTPTVEGDSHEEAHPLP
ncbi:hypothetical protein [Aeromicrobium endophyticum]|uniref:Uncharacterized protein n=1 Tax=Aeromicrobium endophyticum TaxID=2292704 RepID=A0A371PA43_9ACTN|nr:hypothetical protein [Aeromicrobium endophyticum]REK72310.1 hypothetical protein DX116_01330 [Aeromicrobium endophyticum]